MPDKSLKEMCAARYPNLKLAKAVCDSVIAAGCKDKVESGDLVLMHPDDAQRWYDAQQTATTATQPQYAPELSSQGNEPHSPTNSLETSKDGP